MEIVPLAESILTVWPATAITRLTIGAPLRVACSTTITSPRLKLKFPKTVSKTLSLERKLGCMEVPLTFTIRSKKEKTTAKMMKAI